MRRIDELMHSGARFAPRFPILIFVLALACQSTFLALLPDTLGIDESTDYRDFYEPVARNLSSGKGLTTNDGTLATRYPPGFPLLIAVLFMLGRLLPIADTTLVSALMITLASGSAVLIYALGKGMFSMRIGALAAVMWITYVPNLWLVKQPNSEVPYTFVLYLALLALVGSLEPDEKRWGVAAGGLLLGVAMLLRPAGIGLPLLMVAFTWFLTKGSSRAHRFRTSALLVAASLAIVLPWEVIAFAKTDDVIPLATGGPQSVRDGLTLARRMETSLPLPQDVQDLMQGIASDRQELDSLTGIASRMVSETRDQPVTVLKLVLLKAAFALFATDSGRYEVQIAMYQLVYLAVITTGAAIAWRLGGRSRAAALALLGIAAYSWLIAISALSIVRYMVPAMGLLLVLAAFTLDEAGKRIRKLAAPRSSVAEELG